MNFDNLLDLISDSLKSKLILSILFSISAYLIRLILIKSIWSKIEQIQVRLLIRKIINTIVSIVVLIVLISIWINDFNQLGTFLGIVSAGIAIALKDPIVNIVGWFFISVRRPFVIGDRIQISNYAGDVIDISIFQTTILEIGNWVEAEQSTGRILHLPNGIVFNQAVANYTKGFDYIWNEMKILITFESNWNKAKELVLSIANKTTSNETNNAETQIKNASQKYLIKYKNITPTIYTSVKDSGIQLTLRYLCKVRERRYTEHVLWELILNTFEKNKDIEFAYPTQRFFDRSKE